MPPKKRARSGSRRMACEAVPSPVALLEASIASSRSAQSAMQSSADGLIPRLEANTDAASSRTTAATSILITAVQQCVSTFGYSLRRHTTAVDKLLGAKTDELDDTVTTLEACLQQIYCSESSLEYLEASMRTIQQLCGDTNAFPDVSLALHAAASDVLQLGRAAFRLQTTIDPIRCAVSHAPWLARGKVNSLSINVFDAVSEPVTTITPADVSVTTAREAQGWSVEIVSIEGNSLSFGVMLTPECSDVGELNVTIDGHSFVYELKVCASVAAVEAAMAECLRVARIPLTVDGPVPRTDVESLVAACTAAVSSPVVAERFGEVIESLCDSEHEIENGDACSAAGAIPVLVEAVRAHGSGWINVARNGIGALGALIMGVESNADAFVSSPFGGLDVILTVMAAHVLDYDLQRTACWALYNIIRSASATARARLRGGSAEVVKHLNTAIRMHPKEGAWALRDWAQLALTQLVPSQE